MMAWPAALIWVVKSESRAECGEEINARRCDEIGLIAAEKRESEFAWKKNLICFNGLLQAQVEAARTGQTLCERQITDF